MSSLAHYLLDQGPCYLPTETEIVDAKLTIKHEESSLKILENTLTRGREEYDACIAEANRLKGEQIAAILKCHNAEVYKITVSWNQKEANIMAQMKQIEERLTHQRGLVAPVKRLPSEVLSEIFTIQVDRGGTPWTLLSVCRLWNAVASSTPRIWRYIQIDYDRGYFDSASSFQHCFTNAHFEKALSRTGAVPLNLSFGLYGGEDEAADSKRFGALFNTLTKVLDRCDTLELRDTHGPLLAEYQELFATLHIPTPSALRCLRVGTGWGESSITQKILVASNHESAVLRELSITGDGPLVHALAEFQVLLKGLTSFSANALQFPEDTLAAMPPLSYYSQIGFRLALSQMSRVFGPLQEAEFFYVEFQLGSIQFGNLRKLTIQGCTIPVQPKAINVPVLDTLVFEGESWLPILAFDCPRLSRLELDRGPSSKSVAKKEVNQIWGSESGFTQLKVLKINLVMHDDDLVAILKRLVALECLFITLRDFTWVQVHDLCGQRIVAPGDTFFNSLLRNSHRSRILQNLRTLIVQSESCGCDLEMVLPELRANLAHVVHVRRRFAPLWRATLRVTKTCLFDCFGFEEFVVSKETQ